MEQPLGFFGSRGDKEGLSSSKVFVWFEVFVWVLRNLACRRVNLTTLSSIGTLVQVSFCW